jgi:acetyltransferase
VKPDRSDLDAVFFPKSVAVVGISLDRKSGINMGSVYFDSLISCKFPGPIYPVNRRGGEIDGHKVYKHVSDCPGNIDFVISNIDKTQVPQLIIDSAAKGARAMEFFTSGFSESGTDEGRKLEKHILDLGRRYNIRLVGPNGVGLYCPKSGLSFSPDFTHESGNLAFICQSGGNATYFGRLAVARGLRYSKLASFGNAADVNESDLLEYIGRDPDTGLIAIYIEGTRDGRRFMRVLKDIAARKPVVVMKGGQTEPGSRAAASHTGAMTGTTRVWLEALEQAGAIVVDSLEEMADMLVTLRHLAPVRGWRLGVVGMGGGATVMATDFYSAAGFTLPGLSPGMLKRIKSYALSEAGVSLDNPIDLSSQFYNDCTAKTLEAMAHYRGIDLLLFQMPMGILPWHRILPEVGVTFMMNLLAGIKADTDKPVAAVVNHIIWGSPLDLGYLAQDICDKAGIPLYYSSQAAATALARFVKYCRGNPPALKGKARHG